MIRRTLVLAAFLGPVIACHIGETNYVEEVYRIKKASAVMTCSSPFKKVDLSTLEVCEPEKGKGHCYAKNVFEKGDSLIPCKKPGEVCMPDDVLTAGGGKAKSCKSIVGDGACVQMGLIPEMEARGKGLLQKDSCDEGYVCGPCVDPTNGNAPSGLCEPGGVHEEPCVGGASASSETCCHYAGVCLAGEGLPADQRENLEHDTCKKGGLCAPASMIEGTPVKCAVAGIDGVCIDLCFAGMLAGVEPILGVSPCRVTEICMPCAAANAKGMQMPGCS